MCSIFFKMNFDSFKFYILLGVYLCSHIVCGNTINRYYREQNLWIHGEIPYVISHGLGFLEKDLIYDAMGQIENNTCLRFEPRELENSFLLVEFQDIENPANPNDEQKCYELTGEVNKKMILTMDKPSNCSRIQNNLVIQLGMTALKGNEDKILYDPYTGTVKDILDDINWFYCNKHLLDSSKILETTKDDLIKFIKSLF